MSEASAYGFRSLFFWLWESLLLPSRRYIC